MQSAAEAIELNMEDAQASINLADALDRLSSNKDFREVVLEGYFREEAVRLVHLKGAAGARDPQVQTDIDKEIGAIGCLRNYFGLLQQKREWAKQAIEAGREELAMLEEEEAEEEV